MNTAMKIRKYDQNDSAKMISLLDEFIDYTKKSYSKHVLEFESVVEDKRKDFSKQILDYFKGMKKSLFLVAEDDELRGYIVGYVDKKNSNKKMQKAGHIKSFFVSGSYRGKGVGKNLYLQFVDWCKDQGCDHVSLEVFDGNEDTIDMYKRWGFKPNLIKMKRKI